MKDKQSNFRDSKNKKRQLIISTFRPGTLSSWAKPGGCRKYFQSKIYTLHFVTVRCIVRGSLQNIASKDSGLLLSGSVFASGCQSNIRSNIFPSRLPTIEGRNGWELLIARESNSSERMLGLAVLRLPLLLLRGFLSFLAFRPCPTRTSISPVVF